MHGALCYGILQKLFSVLVGATVTKQKRKNRSGDETNACIRKRLIKNSSSAVTLKSVSCIIVDRHNMAYEWKPFFNVNPPSPPESRKFRRNPKLEEKPSEIKSDRSNASTSVSKPISTKTNSIPTKEGSSTA